ncbi:hypothetical protein L209DRAFT_753053 [Thermothelomyces heterothallicus CBS 203.75]
MEELVRNVRVMGDSREFQVMIRPALCVFPSYPLMWTESRDLTRYQPSRFCFLLIASSALVLVNSQSTPVLDIRIGCA